MQESFSRVTARLVEAVHGVQVTQGFARQQTSARMFRDLIADHSVYNMHAARTAGVFVPLLELNSQAFLASILILWAVTGSWRRASARPAGELIQFHVSGEYLLRADSDARDQYNRAILDIGRRGSGAPLFGSRARLARSAQAQPIARIRGQVTFDDVSFAYPARSPGARTYHLHGRAAAMRGARRPYR